MAPWAAVPLLGHPMVPHPLLLPPQGRWRWRSHAVGAPGPSDVLEMLRGEVWPNNVQDCNHTHARVQGQAATQTAASGSRSGPPRAARCNPARLQPCLKSCGLDSPCQPHRHGGAHGHRHQRLLGSRMRSVSVLGRLQDRAQSGGAHKRPCSCQAVLGSRHKALLLAL